jgi:O-antigen ligase
VAAVVVGALTIVNPIYSIGLVLAAAVALIVAADVKTLPLFLVFTMFVESLALGPGLRIGRLAGAMALVVLAYYVVARGWAGLRPNALLLVAAAYGFWTVTSAFWADETSFVYTVVFSYFLATAYMLSFAVFVRTTRQLKAIFATYAVGSLIFGIVSFITYYASSGEQRGSGFQGDPNYFAVYQVLALPAALALSAFERRPQLRLVYYTIVGVIILSVVSSLSRTGLIALSAVVAATLFLPWRTFFRSAGQKVTYFFALALASGTAVLIGSTTFVARAQSILNPESSATSGYRGSGRLDLWGAAVNGWHQHPWLGLGAGNFEPKALDLLQTTPGVNTTAGYVYENRVVHNAYLETLTELGPVGFALFIGVILLTAWYFVASFRRARAAHETALSRFSLALFVALIGYALSAIFLSNQLSRALWILVGLALAIDVMSKRIERERRGELVAPPRPRPPELAVP